MEHSSITHDQVEHNKMSNNTMKDHEIGKIPDVEMVTTKKLCKTQDQESDELKAIDDICHLNDNEQQQHNTKKIPIKLKGICKTQDLESDELKAIHDIWNDKDDNGKMANYTLSEEVKAVEDVWNVTITTTSTSTEGDDDDEFDEERFYTKKHNMIDGIPEILLTQKELEKKKYSQQQEHNPFNNISSAGSAVTSMSTIQRRLTLACVNSIAFEVILSEDVTPNTIPEEEHPPICVSSDQSAPIVLLSFSQDQLEDKENDNHLNDLLLESNVCDLKEEVQYCESKTEDSSPDSRILQEIPSELQDDDGETTSNDDTDQQQENTTGEVKESTLPQHQDNRRKEEVKDDHDDDLDSAAYTTSFSLSLSSSSECLQGVDDNSVMDSPRSTTNAFQMVKDIALCNNTLYKMSADNNKAEVDDVNSGKKKETTQTKTTVTYMKEFEEVYPYYDYDKNNDTTIISLEEEELNIEENDENNPTILSPSSSTNDTSSNKVEIQKKLHHSITDDDKVLKIRDNIITTSNKKSYSPSSIIKNNTSTTTATATNLAEYIESKKKERQKAKIEAETKEDNNNSNINDNNISVSSSTEQHPEHSSASTGDNIISNSSTSIVDNTNSNRTNDLMKLISATKSRLARSQQECKQRNQEMQHKLQQFSTSFDSCDPLSASSLLPTSNPNVSSVQLRQEQPNISSKDKMQHQQEPVLFDPSTTTTTTTDVQDETISTTSSTNEIIPALLQKKFKNKKTNTKTPLSLTCTTPKSCTFSNATTPISRPIGMNNTRPDNAKRSGGGSNTNLDSINNIRARLQSSFSRRSTRNTINNAETTTVVEANTIVVPKEESEVKAVTKSNNTARVMEAPPRPDDRSDSTTKHVEQPREDEKNIVTCETPPQLVTSTHNDTTTTTTDQTLSSPVNNSKIIKIPSLSSPDQIRAVFIAKNRNNATTSSSSSPNSEDDLTDSSSSGVSSTTTTKSSASTLLLRTLASRTADRLKTSDNITLNTTTSNEERERHMKMANLIGKLSKGALSSSSSKK